MAAEYDFGRRPVKTTSDLLRLHANVAALSLTARDAMYLGRSLGSAECRLAGNRFVVLPFGLWRGAA